MPYFDDGKFRIRTFDTKKPSRSEAEIQEEEFDVNAALQLQDSTMVNDAFMNPFIIAEFVDDGDTLFVCLFQNKTLTHYHFLYDVKNRQIKGNHVTYEFANNSKENFPQRCFLNDDTNEIYVFYRQGHSLVIDKDDISKFRPDIMSQQALGQMFLFENKTLIVRSSCKILFFRREHDEKEGQEKWKCYYELEKRGFIYNIRGSKILQVTSDTKVYFYKMCPETNEPRLENVLYNFVNCVQMIFGGKNVYCVAYKTNQRSFNIMRKKYSHWLRTPISNENFNRQIGMEIQGLNSFIVTNNDELLLYDSATLQKKQTVKLELEKSLTRERHQIIAL